MCLFVDLFIYVFIYLFWLFIYVCMYMYVYVHIGGTVYYKVYTMWNGMMNHDESVVISRGYEFIRPSITLSILSVNIAKTPDPMT